VVVVCVWVCCVRESMCMLCVLCVLCARVPTQKVARCGQEPLPSTAIGSADMAKELKGLLNTTDCMKRA
jgi:hypothetical protein